VTPPPAAASFGDLLRAHRLAARLTQQELAERAGLSVHGIQKLERGITHPYRDTTRRLLDALQLGDADEERLRTAALRDPRPLPTQASASERITNNLPIPRTSFIRRAGELDRVADAVRRSRLVTITGSGGCGKTRLALEVSNDLVGSFGDGVWVIDLAPLTDGALCGAEAG
jgi:transcriptional regulator with XRE-family HTH domain